MIKYLALLFLVATGILFYGCGGGKGGSLQSSRDLRSIRSVVVHHTAGEFSNDINRIADGISKLHRKKFRKMKRSMGMYIAYHYLITPNGKVWKVRNPSDIGHHAGNWQVNRQSIAVCLVGDFEKHRPTKAQVQSLNALVVQLSSEYRIKKVFPHSRCRATLCCGRHLKREIKKLPWGRHF